MAKETTLKEIGETLSYIVANMATKDDLGDLRAELKGDLTSLQEQVSGIESELKSTRRELRELTDKVENIEGFRKELDYALEHIIALEKHTGTYKPAAA